MLLAIVARFVGLIDNIVLLVVLSAGVLAGMIARSRFGWERTIVRYCQEESVAIDPPNLALLVGRDKEWEIDLRVVKSIREQERVFDALPNARGRHLVFQLTNGVEVALLIEAPVIGLHPGYTALRKSLAEFGISLARVN